MARVNEELWQTLQQHEVQHFEDAEKMFTTANPDGKCELWNIKYIDYVTQEQKMQIGLLMYDTRLPKDLDVAYIPSGGIHADNNGTICVKTVLWIPAPQVHDAFIRQRDSMNVPSYTPYDEGNEYWRRTFAVCAAMFRDIVSERQL